MDCRKEPQNKTFSETVNYFHRGCFVVTFFFFFSCSKCGKKYFAWRKNNFLIPKYIKQVCCFAVFNINIILSKSKHLNIIYCCFCNQNVATIYQFSASESRDGSQQSFRNITFRYIPASGWVTSFNPRFVSARRYIFWL